MAPDLVYECGILYCFYIVLYSMYCLFADKSSVILATLSPCLILMVNSPRV